jgi:outer membrane receptor for ferrienterochelin and colicin
VAVDVEGNVSLRGSQNVRILIDGRPSGLTGISTADALRQLQGNLIESVEVITNPSARYDAEGEVGIINIILKKKKKKGVNGSFSLNAGYPDNYGASFNINFRRNKLNFFSSYGIS